MGPPLWRLLVFCRRQGKPILVAIMYVLVLHVVHTIQCRLIPPYCLGWYTRTLLVTAGTGPLIGCHYTPAISTYPWAPPSGRRFGSLVSHGPTSRLCVYVLINTSLRELPTSTSRPEVQSRKPLNEQRPAGVDPALGGLERQNWKFISRTSMHGVIRT